MSEEALEGETRRREEVEARLGVAMEDMDRAVKEDEWREVEEAMMRVEEGERPGSRSSRQNGGLRP